MARSYTTCVMWGLWLVLALSFFSEVSCGSKPSYKLLCPAKHGFPESCPRPGDSLNQTKCCRDKYLPSCCLPRAERAFIDGCEHLDLDELPDPQVPVIYCPGPDDPDDHIYCRARSRDEMTCIGKEKSFTMYIALCVGFGLLGFICVVFCIATVCR